MPIRTPKGTLSLMWPFKRRSRGQIDDAVRDAVRLAARQWVRFEETSGVPTNIHLRDRLAYFAPDFQMVLAEHLPILRTAPEELVLLIIAEGIVASGAVSPRKVEIQLGIILPGSDVLAPRIASGLAASGDPEAADRS